MLVEFGDGECGGFDGSVVRRMEEGCGVEGVDEMELGERGVREGRRRGG
jgi:hypothetical protein